MNIEARDGARVRFPPPLLYLLGVLLGVALQRLVLPIPFPLRGLPQYLVASLVGLLALGLIVGAFGKFSSTGQDPRPWTPTPEIVTHGVYRFTRNPMYLSLALLQAAIGVGLANPWVVLLVPLVLTIVYLIVIRPEESYLEAKFGDPYLEYKRSVRRWI